MKTCIYWHRNDLRIHDNECLHVATTQFDQCIPVYIIDPKNYRMLPYGFRKIGIIRHRYIMETLMQLRAEYKSLSGNILIEVGTPETVLTKLATKYKVEAVITQEEVAREEHDDDQKVSLSLNSIGVDFSQIWGRSLYHRDDIPFEKDTVPLTSKAFRINTSKETKPRELLPTPTSVNTPTIDDWRYIPVEKLLGYSDEEIDTAEIDLYPAGELAALSRLDYYTFGSELLTSYKWTRNRSLGMDYSSKLSPYLAVGSLSPRMIYHTVKRYESEIKKNISTWWLIFEIVWRDFFLFKSWRVGDRMFYKSGIKSKEVEWKNDEQVFLRWKKYETGIPFLDAHLKQLAETGFMSNRGRVNAASFLTRDYKIDWRMGAAWFEHCLIDYDVYSNWMNWHTQAFDIYYTNPVHQSLKYDKKGEFILSQFPELSALPYADFHAPWEYDQSQLSAYGIKDYKPPVEIYSKWARSINNIRKQRTED